MTKDLATKDVVIKNADTQNADAQSKISKNLANHSKAFLLLLFLLTSQTTLSRPLSKNELHDTRTHLIRLFAPALSYALGGRFVIQELLSSKKPILQHSARLGQAYFVWHSVKELWLTLSPTFSASYPTEVPETILEIFGFWRD